jgi:hypothetical protein
MSLKVTFEIEQHDEIQQASARNESTLQLVQPKRAGDAPQIGLAIYSSLRKNLLIGFCNYHAAMHSLANDSATELAKQRHQFVSGLFFGSVLLFLFTFVCGVQGYSFAKKRISIEQQAHTSVLARMTYLRSLPGRGARKVVGLEYIRAGRDGPLNCNVERTIDFLTFDKSVKITPIGERCDQVYFDDFEFFPEFWIKLAAYFALVGSTAQIYAGLVRRERIKRSFNV